jgi:uncharacterized protein (TIGR02145 family)
MMRVELARRGMARRFERPVRLRLGLQAAALLAALLLASASPSHAQQNLLIRKTDNTVLSIPLSDIVSITFGAAPAVTAGNTVSDVDGNVYGTVRIGNQVWMAENLRTARYRNGQPIDHPGTDNQAWGTNRSGAYAWYNNDERVFKQPYGASYNWFAVSNPLGLCPAGWHVPSQSEWQILQEFAGGRQAAGGKLKSGRTVPDSHPRWDSPNASATNETGFSAVPSGSRHSAGTYQLLGQEAAFWTSTPQGTTADSQVYNWLIRNNSGGFGNGWTSRNTGHAVRCVRD